MIYLILDTNIWVYMANGFDSIKGGINVGSDQHFELFERIKTAVESEDFKILVNEIIEKEWKRNHARANEHIKVLKKEKRKKLDALVEKRSELKDDEFKKNCKEINDYFEEKIKVNKKHINDVTNLIASSMRYPISDNIKLELAELAINKEKAPFQSSKNNFADAAILFGAIDFLRENMIDNIDGAVFVSNNYSEFGKSKDSNKFHPDIEERVGSLFLEYHRHLGNLLELTEDIQYEIEAFHEYIRETDFYFTCLNPHCYTRDYMSSFGYLDKKVRVESSLEEYDPNQLALFDTDTSKNLYKKYVLSGHCYTCKTTHIECPDCESLLIDVNGDSQFYCNECELGFEMRRCSRYGDYAIYPVEQERLHL